MSGLACVLAWSDVSIARESFNTSKTEILMNVQRVGASKGASY